MFLLIFFRHIFSDFEISFGRNISTKISSLENASETSIIFDKYLQSANSSAKSF